LALWPGLTGSKRQIFTAFILITILFIVKKPVQIRAASEFPFGLSWQAAWQACQFLQTLANKSGIIP
jgi:hypothetical protein